jgi:hypothetical protein
MSRHTTRRIGLAGAVGLVAAVVLAGVAFAHGDDPGPGMDRSDATTFQFFGMGQEDEVFVPVDGDAAREEPMEGDRFLFRDVLFALDATDPNAPASTGDPIGQSLVDCTFRTVDLEAQDAQLVCHAVMELEGRGRLYGVVHLRLSEFEDPGYVTGAVVGGDGTYAGAGGEFTVREFPRGGDEEAPTDSVYEIRL